MEKVPIQSYYKGTLAQVYDNEGEVNWTVQLLIGKIKADIDLYDKLTGIGYKHTSHGFTAEQIVLIFKALHHPVLNQQNRKLLKLPIRTKTGNNFLLSFYELMPEKDINLKPLNELSGSTLKSIGLTKNPNPDYNYYEIDSTDKFCFTRNDGYFNLCILPDFKVLKRIFSTQQLILELIKLKNAKN